jgi:hypothetical protein
VPQGSILGPLLFSLALNDIASVLDGAHYHMYADDATIWVSSHDPAEIVHCLERIGNSLFHYFAGNGLKINSSKCQFMYIASPQKNKINAIKDFASGYIKFNSNAR